MQKTRHIYVCTHTHTCTHILLIGEINADFRAESHLNCRLPRGKAKQVKCSGPHGLQLPLSTGSCTVTLALQPCKWGMQDCRKESYFVCFYMCASYTQRRLMLPHRGQMSISIHRPLGREHKAILAITPKSVLSQGRRQGQLLFPFRPHVLDNLEQGICTAPGTIPGSSRMA